MGLLHISQGVEGYTCSGAGNRDEGPHAGRAAVGDRGGQGGGGGDKGEGCAGVDKAGVWGDDRQQNWLEQSLKGPLQQASGGPGFQKLKCACGQLARLSR